MSNENSRCNLAPGQPESDAGYEGYSNVYMNLQWGNTKKDTFNAGGRFAVRDRLNRNTLDWKSEYEEDDEKKLKDRWLG